MIVLNQAVSDGVLASAIPYLVDERIGIITAVREARRSPGSPNFFHFAAEACNTRAFTRQVNFNITGGAAVDRDRAIAKAIGEAIERYCAAIYDVDELPLHSAEEAPFACARPSEFALYSDAQYASDGFPWVPFADSTPVRWTKASDLLTGEARHVPAAVVYIPYSFYQGSGDSPILQPISTGLAAHTSREQAALGAVYEVIERDAFTITWQDQLNPPQIRAETLPDEAYDLLRRFEHTGAKVVLFDLTMDHGVPTILSVLRNPHEESPALVFAAATSLDPAAAVRSALEELAHTRRYSQQIKSRMDRIVIDPGYTNVVDQVDHLNLYADHANTALAKFLFTSKKRVEFDRISNASTGDVGADLRIVAEKIASIGHRILIADLTSHDVGSLGMFVARAVIPGFHPLFMGHRIRALGGRRLWDVPGKLGYPMRTAASGDNPAPHPYP
jgi:ribosomal protein S12 methylthiotransferase accessory factor